MLAVNTSLFALAVLATGLVLIYVIALLQERQTSSQIAKSGERAKREDHSRLEGLPAPQQKIPCEPSAGFVHGQLLDDFPPNFGGEFENASEVWLVSATPDGEIDQYYPLLKNKHEDGHKINVMLVHPAAALFEPSIRRPVNGKTVEDRINKIYGTLRFTCELQREASDNIQVRTIHFPLGYSAYVFNPGKKSGVIYIKLHPDIQNGEKPILMLRSRDSQLFDQYLYDIRSLWDSGAEWRCEKVI